MYTIVSPIQRTLSKYWWDTWIKLPNKVKSGNLLNLSFFICKMDLYNCFIGFSGVGLPEQCPHRFSYPNPWNLWICDLYGKRDFVDMIKLRILRWADYFGLSSWIRCNHRGPYKREAGDQRDKRWCGHRSRERPEDVMWLGSKVQEGATDQGLQVGKDKKQILPWCLHNSRWYLDLVLQDSFWTSDF